MVTLSVVLLVAAFLIGAALTKLSFLLLAFCGNHSIPWVVAILSGAFILKLLLNHAVGGDNIQLLRYLLFGTHRLLQGTPARPRMLCVCEACCTLRNRQAAERPKVLGPSAVPFDSCRGNPR